MITLHNHNLTQEQIDLIGDIDAAFFAEDDIHIYFKSRRNASMSGCFWNGTKNIDILNAHNPYFHGAGGVMDTIGHELGHLYQYWYDRATWDKLTDYGLELFAEDFKCLVIPNSLHRKDTNPDIWNYKYKGAKTRQEYAELFPTIAYLDNGHYKHANIGGASIKIYAHCVTVLVRRGYFGGRYDTKFMYTIEIQYNGKTHENTKKVKLDTAKKNVIRQLRKWGIDI